MDAKLTIVDVTGSTNDDLLEAGKQGAPHGTGLAAQAQTAGRGRRGHKWDSTAGNLLLSIVLRPCVNPAKYSGLAAVSGLAVLEALKNRVLQTKLASNGPTTWSRVNANSAAFWSRPHAITKANLSPYAALASM